MTTETKPTHQERLAALHAENDRLKAEIAAINAKRSEIVAEMIDVREDHFIDMIEADPRAFPKGRFPAREYISLGSLKSHKEPEIEFVVIGTRRKSAKAVAAVQIRRTCTDGRLPPAHRDEVSHRDSWLPIRDLRLPHGPRIDDLPFPRD